MWQQLDKSQARAGWFLPAAMSVSSQRAWGSPSLALGAPTVCSQPLQCPLWLSPQRKVVKGLENLPHEKHWRSQTLSHCKIEGSSQYSYSSRPDKRKTEAPFLQGTKWRRQDAIGTNAPGEDSSWHKKGIFYGMDSPSLEWPPQSSWRLQDVIEQAVRHNHLGCISRRMIFWAPFHPLLFCSSLSWKGDEALAQGAQRSCSIFFSIPGRVQDQV